MNGFESWDLEAINILVGGTPCQSFSVAGLRKGLADERGNLALVYCRILERFRPKWFVWENVPGVLSSGHGRDFGSFLGAVAKLGYGFAYRVLDAQFFGVPQRRRRVFVVGCLGDWRSAAAVLFERESLLRNTSKGRSKKQEVARTLRGRAHSSHREDSDNFLARACLAKGGTGRLDPSCETFVPMTARTLSARYDSLPCIDRGPEFIACTLPASDGGVSSGMHPVIPFGTLRSHHSKPERVFGDMQVRRLTPRECERLQGFPDDWTAIEYRGKPACDGPRYKAIGNSMAVPVMRWIGERLSANNL
jgi:DNA (cytosine-5)-methyltransferase 1